MPIEAVMWTSWLVDLERRDQVAVHALGDVDRVGGLAHPEGEHRELVAAEPGDGVGGPHELLESARDRHQQAVADRVARDCR